MIKELAINLGISLAVSLGNAQAENALAQSRPSIRDHKVCSGSDTHVYGNHADWIFEMYNPLANNAGSWLVAMDNEGNNVVLTNISSSQIESVSIVHNPSLSFTPTMVEWRRARYDDTETILTAPITNPEISC